MNRLRKRVPFAYWLVFDAVLTPLLIVGLLKIGWPYAIGLALLGVSIVFDVNEAIVKWRLR